MPHHSRIWHHRVRAVLKELRQQATERTRLVEEDLVSVGLRHACDRVDEVINDLLSPAQYLTLQEWGQTQVPPVPRHTVRRWVLAGRFDDRDVVRVGSVLKLRAQALPLPGREEAA